MSRQNLLDAARVADASFGGTCLVATPFTDNARPPPPLSSLSSLLPPSPSPSPSFLYVARVPFTLHAPTLMWWFTVPFRQHSGFWHDVIDHQKIGLVDAAVFRASRKAGRQLK